MNKMSDASFQARFWRRVDKDGPIQPHMDTPCWVWLGALSASGYGRLHSKRTMAHRFAFSIENGPIPDGMFACHACDNRLCVRPDHIWIGTASENNADMAAKGRAARGAAHGSVTHPDSVAVGARNGAHTMPERVLRGDRHWSKVKPDAVVRGERHGMARLSREDAVAIRSAIGGGQPASEVAAQYGVSAGHARRIARGVLWGCA